MVWEPISWKNAEADIRSSSIAAFLPTFVPFGYIIGSTLSCLSTHFPTALKTVLANALQPPETHDHLGHRTPYTGHSRPSWHSLRNSTFRTHDHQRNHAWVATRTASERFHQHGLQDPPAGFSNCLCVSHEWHSCGAFSQCPQESRLEASNVPPLFTCTFHLSAHSVEEGN